LRVRENVNDSKVIIEDVSIESPSELDVVERPKPCGKPGRSGPPGNQNNRKHGLYARNAGHVDMRRREDRAVAEALAALERDLGSDELSAQERIILAGIGRRLRDLFKIDGYLDTLSSIANRRRRALHPIVIQKHAILDAIRRDLEALGLKRRTRELTISSWLSGKNEPVDGSRANGASTGQPRRKNGIGDANADVPGNENP
jgi:hypothetical protein